MDAETEKAIAGSVERPGSAVPMLRRHIMQAISAELDHAYEKHGRGQWGRHEFYAILKEEVDEMWDAIKADDPIEDVRAEAIQIAAMVFRYLETGDRYQPNDKLSHGGDNEQ